MSVSLSWFYRHNRRILIWIILIAILFLLRDFFGLIFLTFALSFIGAGLAELGQERLRMPRRASVLVVYGFFLVAIVSAFLFVVPAVVREVNTLLGNLGQVQKKMAVLKDELVVEFPPLKEAIPNYLRGALDDERREVVERELRLFRDELTLTERDIVFGRESPPPNPDLAARIRRFLDREDELLFRAFNAQQAENIRGPALTGITALGQASGTILLALLFSFLITLDFVRIKAEIGRLRDSRLHDFYEQTAQPVVRFGYVVGRAIQAQAMIASVNTFLTLLGMAVLGVPLLAALSLVVFLCSFIPVLGVFISTVPILIVGLNAGGIQTAALVLLMVLVVHAVEAYLLNPMIYGAHLKLNPVLVLAILLIGFNLFGAWGMLLGVPVAHYFIHDVFGVPVWGEKRIKPPPRPPPEPSPMVAEPPGDDEGSSEEPPAPPPPEVRPPA